MNVSKMSREKIAAALAKGGRYMNHARQWVAVKVGERVNPDDIALALVSPDALIVREAVRMASKAGRGAKRAAGSVARKVRKNPTGTGAAAVGERGGWSIVKPEKRDDAGGVLAGGPSRNVGGLGGPALSVPVSSRAAGPHHPEQRSEDGSPAAVLPARAARTEPGSRGESVAGPEVGRRARCCAGSVLASSTPADSAPVVWRGTGERSEVFLVVSGNGRTMAAILAFETESEAWEQYLSAVASRWNMAAKLDELDRDERFLAVRVLGGEGRRARRAGRRPCRSEPGHGLGRPIGPGKGRPRRPRAGDRDAARPGPLPVLAHPSRQRLSATGSPTTPRRGGRSSGRWTRRRLPRSTTSRRRPPPSWKR